MGWFRRDRKTESPADIVAADLFRLMVEQPSRREDPKKYKVPRAVRADFRTKVHLYNEALVLLALLSQVRDDRRFEVVLQSYERLIFPSTPTAEGLDKFDSIKAAMRDLHNLMYGSDKGRELSWARAWMNNITHDESNPVILVQLVTHFMDIYISTSKYLERVAPTYLALILAAQSDKEVVRLLREVRVKE